MMKKICYLCIAIPFLLFSQEVDQVEESAEVEEITTKAKVIKDSIVYNKSLEYQKRRNFAVDINEAYSGNDFKYKEEKEKELKEVAYKTPRTNPIFIASFAAFMKMIFPFLLAAIVLYIVVKLYVGSPSNLWNFKEAKNKVADKLIYEDEDIENTDIEGLLKRALTEKNTRLAVRYYYLLLLQKLSHKEIIKYDKDKTNSEYLFEISNKNIRKDFSYLSYIYSYVWYGDFSLNDSDFARIQERYKSFFKTIN